MINQSHDDWLGSIRIHRTDAGSVATLSNFTGNDGLQPDERLELWADALEDLAASLRKRAATIRIPLLP